MGTGPFPFSPTHVRNTAMGIQTIHTRYINIFGRRFVWYRRTIKARATFMKGSEA